MGTTLRLSSDAQISHAAVEPRGALRLAISSLLSPAPLRGFFPRAVTRSAVQLAPSLRPLQRRPSSASAQPPQANVFFRMSLQRSRPACSSPRLACETHRPSMPWEASTNSGGVAPGFNDEADSGHAFSAAKGSRGSDPRLLGLTVGRLLDSTFGERPRASRIVQARGLDQTLIWADIITSR